MAAAGVNPHVSPSPRRGFDCPVHKRTESGSLIVTTMGGVHHFYCHLCGGGAVGPATLVARSFGVSIKEGANALSRVGAFVGPEAVFESQVVAEEAQDRVVRLYLDALASGEQASNMDDFWSPAGTSFLGRAACEARDLARAIGPLASRGVSESRGSKALVPFRILWAPCGAPSVLLVESRSGAEARRIRLDRQPLTDFALLSCPPHSLRCSWTDRVVAFCSESSAITMWPWISEFCSRNQIAAVAVHSTLGSPERSGQFGDVDILVEGVDSSINGLVFEGGVSSNVKVVRIANGSRKRLGAAELMKMEASPSWRHNLLRPMDDMVSIISNLCDENLMSMAEVAMGSVVSSGLVTARQRCEFLTRVSAFDSPGAVESLIDIAMSTPVTAPGFVLIPTPSGYIRRSTKDRPEPDSLVTNFRIMPVCSSSSGSGASHIVKIVSPDGAEVLSSISQSCSKSPARFAEEIRRGAAEYGVQASIMDGKAAKALCDSVFLGGMGAKEEITQGLGFFGGEFVSPDDIGAKSQRSSLELSDWIARKSGIRRPSHGWRETLASLIEEDLSAGDPDLDAAGPTIALALAMEFLRSCAESIGETSMFLADEKMLEMVSAVSGIPMATGEWVQNLNAFPFKMRRVPVCLPRGVRVPPRNFSELIMTSEARVDGVIGGPGLIGVFAADGVDTLIPTPDLVEISRVAVGASDIGVAISSMLGLSREFVQKCREAYSEVSRAVTQCVPGFVRAFREFAKTPRFEAFVMGRLDDGSLLLSKEVIRMACLEFGIATPSERRGIPILISSGACSGVHRKKTGVRRRERMLIVPPSAPTQSNIVEMGSTGT